MKKKALLIIGLSAAVLLVGAGSAYAAGEVAKNNSIDEVTAKRFAYMDANVNEKDVTKSKAEFEYEDGHYVYEVEFYASGVEYEYDIKASDGRVLEKNIKIKNPVVADGNGKASSDATVNDDEGKTVGDGGAEQQAEDKRAEEEKNQKTMNKVLTAEEKKKEEEVAIKAEKKSIDNSSNKTSSKDIGVDKAKSIALNNAGLKEKDVVFSKAKLDKEDGVSVYEVEFYHNGKEYEYEIRVSDGTIVDVSIETDDDNKTAAANVKKTDSTKASDADSTVSAEKKSKKSTKSKKDRDDDDDDDGDDDDDDDDRDDDD